MKIAMTYPGCHRRGGVERVILECANYLQSRGHETHVFANEFDEATLLRGVVREKLTPTFGGGVAGMFDFSYRSRRALARAGYFDIRATFGVQSPPDGVLWMQSVHKAWIDISKRLRSGVSRYKQLCNPFHPVALAYERHIVGGRRYRKLIALSQRVKDDLIHFYNVPSHDIVIVPNGFNATEFNPQFGEASRDELRRGLGIENPNTPVILFVANELERKGFRPLIQALARSRHTDACIVAVGRFNPADVAPEIEALGLARRVIFRPSSSNLKPLYLAADLFALPTQYEAWGLVIVEAMACGLPVLTSRLAGAAVAVREGVSGLLLDNPLDVEEVTAKLDGAIAMRVDRSLISDSVEMYRWENVLPAYERVLIECARPQPSRNDEAYAYRAAH